MHISFDQKISQFKKYLVSFFSSIPRNTTATQKIPDSHKNIFNALNWINKLNGEGKLATD